MPNQINDPRKQTLPEIAFTGLRQSSGVIREEFLPSLTWPKQNAVFKEMSSNDSVVSGMLFAMEMIIRKVSWSVQDNGDPEGKAFLESVMNDMEKSWSDTINDILSFLAYGYSIHEPVFKKRMGNTGRKETDSKFKDGHWGWRKLPIRSQDTIYRWVFDGEQVDQTVSGYINVTGTARSLDAGDLKGVIQYVADTGQYYYIPKNRFLLFRNNTKKDNPESVSILRGAYRPWFFKKNIEEYEAIGVERNLVGLPVAYIPAQYFSPEASPDEKSLFSHVQSIVTDVRANRQGGLVWPTVFDDKGNKLFDLKILGTDSNSKVMDTDKIIQRHNASIAQSVLADFILLGQNSVGSFALSTNKIKLFHAAISSWLDSISSVFNKQAIPFLWELNGWEVNETIPTIKPGQIDNFSLEELGKYFAELTDKGAVRPTKELNDWLLSKADAPVGEEPMETVDESIAKIRSDANIHAVALQNIEGLANQGITVDEAVDLDELGDKELIPVPSNNPPLDSPPT